jgi:hypothetical protein
MLEAPSLISLSAAAHPTSKTSTFTLSQLHLWQIGLNQSRASQPDTPFARKGETSVLSQQRKDWICGAFST